VSGWQAIVFDLDDTLYPERDYVRSGFAAVAAWSESRLGVDAAEGRADLQALFDRGVRGTTFDEWLRARGLPREPWIAQLVDVYRAHEPSLCCFPGVRELLRALGERHRLGLVSDGLLAVQRRKLAALGIEGFFDAVVFSDEGGRAAWKPSPRPFRIVLERLRVPPARAVYVADNAAKDFLGARRAGMGTVWVRRPGGEYASLDPPSADHAPDREIADLSFLNSALDSFAGPVDPPPSR
jgi:putative hydrolase of the HAD superfamily